jgi:hypothetical protein
MACLYLQFTQSPNLSISINLYLSLLISIYLYQSLFISFHIRIIRIIRILIRIIRIFQTANIVTTAVPPDPPTL